MTRAERREQQERQRAEKAARQAAAKQVSKPSKPATTPRSQGSSAVNTPTRAQSGKGAPEPPAPREQGGLALFSHLPPPRHMDVKAALQRTRGDVHPSIVRLGLDYANGAVRGADARCVAMLEAFREVVKDYRVPEGKTLQRDLVAHLSVNVGFLVEARPLGTAMGNAIKYLKTYVTHLDGRMDEDDAREAVLEMIDAYIRVRWTHTWRIVSQPAPCPGQGPGLLQGAGGQGARHNCRRRRGADVCHVVRGAQAAAGSQGGWQAV